MVQKNWANTFQVSQMRRRQFIGLIGGAAAWPLAARGQQASLPVIGSLSTGSAAPWAPFIAAFLEGLGEAGFVDGRNVSIEYRWAQNDRARLPGLVADLIRQRVAVIATPGSLAARISAVRFSCAGLA